MKLLIIIIFTAAYMEKFKETFKTSTSIYQHNCSMYRITSEQLNRIQTLILYFTLIKPAKYLINVSLVELSGEQMKFWRMFYFYQNWFTYRYSIQFLLKDQVNYNLVWTYWIERCVNFGNQASQLSYSIS